jgi:ribonucleoside-diphosphate reductase alpha chain
MAAAIQECVDSVVATTIPFPRSTRVPDVYGAYLQAWEWGCMGITAYVDADWKEGVVFKAG